MKHNVIIECTQSNDVTGYHLEPPLPKDPFSYVIINYDYEGKQVVTGKPYITETTAEFSVHLETAVFPKLLRLVGHYGHNVSHMIPKPVKEIRVTALVKALRYGGNLFLYGGLINPNPASELPLKVLRWKITFEYGKVRYESGCDSYRKTIMYEIGAPPSAYDVFVAENKQWPQEPCLKTNLERFFFQRWLKDRSLTLDNAQPLYEDEVLKPHRHAIAKYNYKIAESNSYYTKWLKHNEVLLVEPEAIWRHINEALTQESQHIAKQAENTLRKAMHPEFVL